MTTPRRIGSKLTVECALATGFIAIVTVQFFILYFIAPLIGDDAMFANRMHGVSDDGGLTVNASLRQIGAGLSFDGRLSNTIACILLLLPRWISAAILSILFIGAALFSLRQLAPERFTLAGIVWMLSAGTFFIGWFDSMFLIDLACNYLVPTVLILAYCWLFFNRRRGKWYMVAGLITAVLSGLTQQISFAPLLVASAIILCVNFKQSTLRQWMMSACLLVGVFGCFHPMIIGRMHGNEIFSMNLMLRHAISFVLFFVWCIFIIIKLRGKNREQLVHSVASPKAMLWIVSAVTLILSIGWGTGARMAFGVTLFSAAGIAAWLPRFSPLVRNWLMGVLACITIAHLAYADVMSIRTGKEFRKVFLQMRSSDASEIIYEEPAINPCLSLGKVYTFSQARPWIKSLQDFYCSENSTKTEKSIIPRELQNINREHLVPLEGTAKFFRYKKWIISPNIPDAKEYMVSYGPFTKKSELLFSRFHSKDDGDGWFLVDIILPSTLLNLYDIYKIDKI